MKIFDQHLHSKFSYDSSEEIRNYLENTDRAVTIADTLAFNNLETFEDNILDYENYTLEIENLKKEFPGRIFKGIEIAYSKGRYPEINQYLEEKEFDIVYLSVRNDGENDFLGDEVTNENINQHVESYFTIMLEAVQNIPRINVISKLDYGIRRTPLSMNLVKIIVDNHLTDLFDQFILKNIGIEINGKGCFNFGNFQFYTYAIPLFLASGGKYVTIGSDAATVNDLELSLEKLIQIIPEEKLQHLVYFQNEKPYSFQK